MNFEWPREESNLRPQIRSLPLYPLSYGASGSQYARAALRRSLGFLLVPDACHEDADDRRVEVAAGAAHELVQRLLDGERLAVRSGRRHRDVRVAGPDDPGGERDVVACEPVRVAASVPVLV